MKLKMKPLSTSYPHNEEVTNILSKFTKLTERNISKANQNQKGIIQIYSILAKL